MRVWIEIPVPVQPLCLLCRVHLLGYLESITVCIASCQKSHAFNCDEALSIQLKQCVPEQSFYQHLQYYDAVDAFTLKVIGIGVLHVCSQQGCNSTAHMLACCFLLGKTNFHVKRFLPLPFLLLNECSFSSGRQIKGGGEDGKSLSLRLQGFCPNPLWFA